MNSNRKRKNSSYDELSNLIADSISEEPFFDKVKIKEKVKALLSGFSLNLNRTRYNKIEEPTDAARRLLALESSDFQMKFWQKKVKALVGEKIEGYYFELDELLKQNGFKK
jgi:hypothetical protein